MTVYENWERLVRATLQREQLRSAGQRPGQSASGLAGAVPPSLGRTTNIDAILQAADEIEDDDPNVARIRERILPRHLPHARGSSSSSTHRLAQMIAAACASPVEAPVPRQRKDKELVVELDSPPPPPKGPKIRRGGAVRRCGSRSTAREASDSDALARHPNFEMGGNAKDRFGEPILHWDETMNRVSLSSHLPSWAEGEPTDNAAYNLTYGLYARQDAATFKETSMRDLAYMSSRARLRATELSHMVARRGLKLSRRFAQVDTARQVAEDRAADLATRLGVAERLLEQSSGGLGPDAANSLKRRVEELEQEVESLKTQLAEARARRRVGGHGESSRTAELLHFTPAEVEVAHKKIVVKTAETVINILRKAEAFRGEWNGVTADMLLPEYFPSTSHPDSPSSGHGYSPSA